MNTSDDASERLLRLEQAIADSRGDVGPDPIASIVSRVTDRLRRTTAELRRRPIGHVDAIDAVTMRLVLLDYQTALAHLRAAARASEQRISTAAASIKGGSKLVERALEQRRGVPG